jgi:hypothetical protein
MLYYKTRIAVKNRSLIECYAEIKCLPLFTVRSGTAVCRPSPHYLGVSASHYELRSQQATSLRIPTVSLVNRSKLKSIKGQALS